MPRLSREIVMRMEVSVDSEKVSIDIDPFVANLITGMRESVHDEVMELISSTSGDITITVAGFDVYDLGRGRPASTVRRGSRLKSY